MPTLASAVLTETRGLLNDTSAAIYADAALIPLLNKSYTELQMKMAAGGFPVSKEQVDSPGQTVVAGTIKLGDGSGLPADLVYPISIGERDVGASVDFTDLDRTDWEPDVPQQRELRWWNWREEEIKFRGATSDRQIRIRYLKSLTPITASTTPIQIINSTTWLAQRTAALASLVIGANPTRAEALVTDLRGVWDDFSSIQVRRLQALPVRRRRTRYRVR